jgi:hypothetical protein
MLRNKNESFGTNILFVPRSRRYRNQLKRLKTISNFIMLYVAFALTTKVYHAVSFYCFSSEV